MLFPPVSISPLPQLTLPASTLDYTIKHDVTATTMQETTEKRAYGTIGLFEQPGSENWSR